MNATELAKNLADDLANDSLDINGLLEYLENIAETFIENNTKRVPASALGFGDDRVGSVLIENSDYPEIIITDGFFSRYYSGFDYVANSAIKKIGRYTIYSNEDSRVDEHLEFYHENQK